MESQSKNINKCQKEIIENINTKSNDLKGINSEIEGLKKRMEATTKEIAGLQRSFGTKKLVSDVSVIVLFCLIRKDSYSKIQLNKFKMFLIISLKCKDIGSQIVFFCLGENSKNS